MTDDEYDEYVKQIVAQAPPLRPNQIARLAGLFDAPPQQGDAATTGSARMKPIPAPPSLDTTSTATPPADAETMIADAATAATSTATAPADDAQQHADAHAPVISGTANSIQRGPGT